MGVTRQTGVVLTPEQIGDDIAGFAGGRIQYGQQDLRNRRSSEPPDISLIGSIQVDSPARVAGADELIRSFELDQESLKSSFLLRREVFGARLDRQSHLGASDRRR